MGNHNVNQAGQRFSTDKTKVFQGFDLSEAAQIISIHISAKLPNDNFVWKWEKDDIYSVRTAYHAQCEEAGTLEIMFSSIMLFLILETLMMLLWILFEYNLANPCNQTSHRIDPLPFAEIWQRHHNVCFVDVGCFAGGFTCWGLCLKN